MAQTAPDYDIEITQAIGARPQGYKGEATADTFFSDPNAAAAFGGFMQAQRESDRFTYIYWRKPLREGAKDGDRGEIIPMPGWDAEYVQYSEMGFKPLLKYGRFRVNNPSEPGGSWNILQEPYRRILTHPTGPSEFDITQIAENQWDIKSPYGVRFPQLDGVVINRVKCGVCRKLFLNKEDAIRHEIIVHKERAANENLARTLSEASSGGAESLANAVKVMGEAVASMAARQAQSDARIAFLMEEMMKDRVPAVIAEVLPVEAPAKTDTKNK